MFRRLSVCLGLLLTLSSIVSACGTPPDREIHEAQGGIDAARAAGAERYATEELKAATDALALARDAVNQRDYRLALNHALDSRERAQTAAKMAADGKAQARSEAERALAETTIVLTEARDRLKQVQTARVPPRRLDDARQKITDVEAAVQKAGEALAHEDYLAARDALRGAADHARAALTDLDGVPSSQSPRRPR